MKHGLCVIGYGGMGGWHAEHALDSDVVRLVGVHDIKADRNALARQRGIRAYDRLEDALADPAAEIMVIAIPNDGHEPVAVRCMEAGKHVICEKPVAVSAASLERMLNAAKRCGVVFTAHQNRRWDADFLAIKRLREGGAVGDIIDIESRIHGSRGIPGDWRGKAAHGGGMLLDWGVHLIDQLLTLYPDDAVLDVRCEFDHITNDEVDDGFRLTLRMAGGARLFVEVGTYNFLSMPRFYVRGTRGSALIPDWREPCRVTECLYWREGDAKPVRAAAGLTKTMAPRDEATIKTYELPRPEADVHDFYRNFCGAVDGAATLTVTHAQLLRVMNVIDAAFDSARRGCAVAATPPKGAGKWI